MVCISPYKLKYLCVFNPLKCLQYFGHLVQRIDSLEKTLMLGGIGGKRKRGQQRMSQHYRLNGREFEWTLGVGDGQGGLACCRSWGCKELDTTERLNWTEIGSTPIFEQNEIVNSLPDVDIYYNQNYVYFCIFTFWMKDAYFKEDNCLIHHCHQHYAKLLMIYNNWISACHVNFPFYVHHVNLPFLSLASFH